MDQRKNSESPRDSRPDADILRTAKAWPPGYRMIESFEVEGFRSLRHLQLDGLTTINLIVGKSAAGKTALLEAIRVGLGATPTVAWTVSHQRGVPIAVPLNPTKEQFEATWRPLFFDFKTDQTIKFKIVDSEKRTASLEIFFDTDRPVTPFPNAAVAIPGQQIFTNTIVPLSFRRIDFAGEPSSLDATVHQQQHGQLHLQQGPELGPVSEFFSSTWQSNATQVANWFSQLRISQQADDIIKIVHASFPEIKSLSSESPFGVPSIYASVNHRSQLMPLGLLSAGINKFVSLMIAIRTLRNGVVLIDEIENGMYFRMFPSLWRAVYKFAKENNTQIFVTSHSLECLRGAADVIDKHASDFSLIQIINEDGTSKAYKADGKSAAAAIEGGIEVRK